MKIIISNTSDTPLYQQIKEQIKSAIFKQEIIEDAKLPSIRALANDLEVSVLTTKRVYAELEKEGFIITKAGRGCFVAPENIELLKNSRRRLVEEKLLEAWEMAMSLGINKQEVIEMMYLIFEEGE